MKISNYCLFALASVCRRPPSHGYIYWDWNTQGTDQTANPYSPDKKRITLQFSQPFSFAPIFEKGALGSVLSLGWLQGSSVTCRCVPVCCGHSSVVGKRPNARKHHSQHWFLLVPCSALEVSATVSASSIVNKFPKPAGLYDPLLMGNTSREGVLICTYFFLQSVLGKGRSCLPAVCAAAGALRGSL